MTITTTIPEEQQPESTPAPIEPPSTPAPETVEPPVSEATQPADAVTAEYQSAVKTPVTSFGSPMIVHAAPVMSLDEIREQLASAAATVAVSLEVTADLQDQVTALQRMLKQSQAARTHLVSSVKAWASRGVNLQTRRDRLIRRALAYRKALETARHHAANQDTIIAMYKDLTENAKPAPVAAPATRSEYDTKLSTAHALADKFERDLDKAQQRIAELEAAVQSSGTIRGQDVTYWYGAWSAVMARGMDYKFVGDPNFFKLAELLLKKAGEQ